MNSSRFALRPLRRSQGRTLSSKLHQPTQPFTISRTLRQPHNAPEQPVNVYRSHGRALFKALTLAFFSYQVVYWGWLILETEELKDHKDREIKALENEVRLLDEQRKTRPAS